MFFIVKFKSEAVAIVLKFVRDVFTFVVEVIVEEDLLH